MTIVSISLRLQEYEIEFLTWNSVFLAIVIIAVFLGFYFYTRLLRERATLQQKETEYMIQQQYIELIDMQQSVIRKFKHDQQNVLLSMEGYLDANDYDGLKDYFYSQIKTSTESVTQSDFLFEDLSRIKVYEIKGILTVKLTMAQDMGINTVFQVADEIDSIPCRSIVLVRMLGIILDNAIEALMELDDGTLSVACYKEGNSVVFIVQNDCQPNLPPVSQIKQAGFTTKGDGRGLGLSNL